MVLMCRDVWKYSLLSGAEQAVTSTVQLGAASTLSDYVSAVLDAQDDLWAVVRAQVPTVHSVSERVIEELDPGTGAVTASHSIALPASPAGSNSGGPLPLQCSTVLSIRTATAGRSGRGRIYLPPLGKGTVEADTTLVSSVKTAFVNAHLVYFDSIFADSGMHLGVWSPTLLGWTQATKIDMGSIFDTQRRRRHKLVEGRYSVDLS